MAALYVTSVAINLQVPIKKNDTITITKVASGLSTDNVTVSGETSCTLTSERKIKHRNLKNQG